jgi:hypothetical protein
LAITLATSSRGLALRSSVMRFEIHEEVGDHALDGGQRLRPLHGARVALVAIQVRVLGPEQLLGQLEHARLVLGRHAEDLHDHP